LISNAIAASVGSISDCPALAPRASPAKDITDLRIDDINIVAGLGDR
jgi:phospholipase B1